MTVWTLAVDTGKELVVTVHASEQECLNALRVNYDTLNEFTGEEWMQDLLNANAITVTIDEHEVPAVRKEGQ